MLIRVKVKSKNKMASISVKSDGFEGAYHDDQNMATENSVICNYPFVVNFFAYTGFYDSIIRFFGRCSPGW